MKLSLQTDYALRLLMFMSARPTRTTIATVATFYGISKEHLAKVVQRLARLGWIRSVRGVHGGLELAAEPNQLTVGQVIREFEGDVHLLDCIGATRTVCVIQPGCRLRGVLAKAEQVQRDYLDSVRLSDVITPGEDLAALTQGLVQLGDSL